jgi:hypothetical protein
LSKNSQSYKHSHFDRKGTIAGHTFCTALVVINLCKIVSKANHIFGGQCRFLLLGMDFGIQHVPIGLVHAMQQVEASGNAGCDCHSAQ